MPISIISKSQALALVGEWMREYHSVISSQSSVVGSESTSCQSAGFKPIDRKPANQNLKTENRKPITGYPKIIVTPNPEMIVAAQSDPEFLKALQSADLAIPDGIGVVWAVRLLEGRRTKDEGRRQSGSASSRPSAFSLQPSAFTRLSGLDLMESLILQPQKVGPFEPKLKIMLLGGRPGVAQKAAEKLRYQIRSISGSKDISNISKSENNHLISEINLFSPDLLFIAFGHGQQEKWLSANRPRLKVAVAMGVGGALDQIADPSLRPPAYINSIGLGWLYRLIRQPWRWKRQLALIKFVVMVIKDRILDSLTF